MMLLFVTPSYRLTGKALLDQNMVRKSRSPGVKIKYQPAVRNDLDARLRFHKSDDIKFLYQINKFFADIARSLREGKRKSFMDEKGVSSPITFIRYDYQISSFDNYTMKLYVMTG